MGKAKAFLKKMKFVEDMESDHSEMSADKNTSKKLEDDAQAMPNIDTDDDQILAVMNGYFKHVNGMELEDQCDQLQDLCHRMANVMLGMPGGEKALRNSLKGAIKGLGPAPAANEDKNQANDLQLKIDDLKTKKDDLKAQIDKDPKTAGAKKDKMADIDKQISSLMDQKKSASKNEKRKRVSESSAGAVLADFKAINSGKEVVSALGGIGDHLSDAIKANYSDADAKKFEAAWKVPVSMINSHYGDI